MLININGVVAKLFCGDLINLVYLQVYVYQIHIYQLPDVELKLVATEVCLL